MKLLIAVMTCQRPAYIAKANAQRATWVPSLRSRGIDVVFFSGQANTPWQDDEVRFDLPDTYLGIPQKVQAICRWAYQYGYSYVMKCDDDVYIAPNRLPLPAPNHHYLGRFRTPYGKYPVHFASGFSYWLSHEAARKIGSATWNGDWMDERWVATVLAYHGIYGHTDVSRWCVTGPHTPGKDVAAHNVLKHGAIFCEYGAAGLLDMHAHMGKAGRQIALVVPDAPRPTQPVTDAILTMKPDDFVPERKLHLCRM